MRFDKETRTNIKETIKALVERKVQLTRERREYKLRTRPLLQTEEITESERRRFFSKIDRERSDLKYEIRHALLLYGYLRGFDYKRLEPKVRDGNKPSETALCKQANRFGISCSESQAKAWFTGEPSPYRRKNPHDEEEAA